MHANTQPVATNNLPGAARAAVIAAIVIVAAAAGFLTGNALQDAGNQQSRARSRPRSRCTSTRASGSLARKRPSSRRSRPCTRIWASGSLARKRQPSRRRERPRPGRTTPPHPRSADIVNPCSRGPASDRGASSRVSRYDALVNLSDLDHRPLIVATVTPLSPDGGGRWTSTQSARTWTF